MKCAHVCERVNVFSASIIRGVLPISDEVERCLSNVECSSVVGCL